MRSILTAIFVFFGLILVLPSDQRNADKMEDGKVYEGSIIQDNFRRFFDSIGKNDAQKTKTYRGILEHETAKGQQAFDTMKEELQVAQKKKNVNRQRNLSYRNLGQNVVPSKREIPDKNQGSACPAPTVDTNNRSAIEEEPTTVHKGAGGTKNSTLQRNADEKELQERKPARGVFTKMKKEIESLRWMFTLEEEVPFAIEAAESLSVVLPESVPEEHKALYESSYRTWIAILNNSRMKRMLPILKEQFEKKKIIGNEKIAETIARLYVLLNGSIHVETTDEFKTENDVVRVLREHWKTTDEDIFKAIRVVHRLYRTPLGIYKSTAASASASSPSSMRYGF